MTPEFKHVVQQLVDLKVEWQIETDLMIRTKFPAGASYIMSTIEVTDQTRMCPLTALCYYKTFFLFGEGEYVKAAEKLNLGYKVADLVVNVADSACLNEEEMAAAEYMIAALGLNDKLDDAVILSSEQAARWEREQDND